MLYQANSGDYYTIFCNGNINPIKREEFARPAAQALGLNQEDKPI